MRRIITASAATAFLFTSLLMAATPPALMNYEGVLRNSANAPLSGDYDMLFRFLDTLSGEVLVDSHTSSSGGQVSVSGGLFNVALGCGTVTDGSSPGVYTSLDQVFRDNGTVYLQITIGSETLTPPIRVVSAAYALNATNLAGKSANQYLDTSSFAQAKSGPLTITSVPTGPALDVTGSEVAAHFIAGFNEAFLGDGSIGRGMRGSGNIGVEGTGPSYGGYFHNQDANGGVIQLGGATIGMTANVNSASGYTAHFVNDYDGSDVYIGLQGQYGIRSNISAGTALSATSTSGYGVIGNSTSSIGVAGSGVEGGFFASNETSSYGRIGATTYKIQGSGAVSFVQNHPFDKKRVIVYASPEGDEVGVYTRGSARLENGEARVALGETFQWVTNPDIGLTAHLTPRGGWSELYVESVSPNELVVKSAGGNPTAAFDYVVQGLRIGFEEVSIVQEKQRESFIPSMAEHRQRYARQPELRAYNALERFRAMPAAAGAVSVDGAGARALKSAVHEYDLATDGPVDALAGFAARVGVAAGGVAAAARPDDAKTEHSSASDASVTFEASNPRDRDARIVTDLAAGSGHAVVVDPQDVNDVDHAVMLPVAGIVEAGDVLVADAESTGSLRRASMAADPAVIVVAAGLSGGGRAAVITSGVVICKVDASYGSIRPGDLLAASPTPGHAMKHSDALAGTILGKALERLDDGAGLMKILLTVR